MDQALKDDPVAASMCASRPTAAGFGLLEAIMAMGLIMLIAMSTTQAFLASNRIAATNRALTAARAIVQRNLDTALSVRFDGTTEPTILAITPAAGASADDGGGDGKVNILTQKTGTTETVLVKGDLRRFVFAETNPQNAIIRRVTFRLTYTFQRRNFTVDMTALRAIDD